MKSIRVCLGENIHRLRHERSLTQSALAKLCDLSLSFLQNIETGKKWASAETIECLAHHLKVSESELFIDHERVYPQKSEEVIRYLMIALNVKI